MLYFSINSSEPKVRCISSKVVISRGREHSNQLTQTDWEARQSKRPEKGNICPTEPFSTPLCPLWSAQGLLWIKDRHHAQIHSCNISICNPTTKPNKSQQWLLHLKRQTMLNPITNSLIFGYYMQQARLLGQNWKQCYSFQPAACPDPLRGTRFRSPLDWRTTANPLTLLVIITLLVTSSHKNVHIYKENVQFWVLVKPPNLS